MKTFKLPDLGEGLQDAEIVEWHVKVGDLVKLDQSLVSMETAKAIVEVPSPMEGKVIKLFGNPGDIIETGSPLVEFENALSAPEEKKEEKESMKTENKLEPPSEGATVAGKLSVQNNLIYEPMVSQKTSAQSQKKVKATPLVRALAQRLKVDLSSVTPTGPEGSITQQDIENASKQKHKSVEKESPETEMPKTSEKSETSEIGFQPLKGTRRAMAHIMAESHKEVVPITVMDDARLLHWSKEEDISVRIIQALCAACQKEPSLNAWYDSKKVAMQSYKEVHLGLAMDTKDGLFVPVIRNCNTLDSEALRNKINEFKKTVTERTISPEELKGATISLSNFGKFAGRYANPIIVPPMVAILGVGKLRDEVIVVNGEQKICPVLPLAVTFDHRAVTGGEATRFLGDIIEALEK